MLLIDNVYIGEVLDTPGVGTGQSLEISFTQAWIYGRREMSSNFGERPSPITRAILRLGGPALRGLLQGGGSRY